MAKPSLAELRAVTYKRRDAWWTVLLVDPIAVHLVRMVIGMRWITPNRITGAAFVLGLGSAACFLGASTPWLIAGALLYHLAFILDCVDGKVARWQGSGTVFGGYLDFILDQIRMAICTVALMAGQWMATGRDEYLYLALVVVFVDMFRYVNAFHMEKAREAMRGQLGEQSDRLDGAPAAVDIQRTFRSRFSFVLPLRDWLTRHRIRPDLISGIEFQMLVLVIAPLTGWILPVSAVAIVLMLGFEFVMSYKFWLSTKDFGQAVDSDEAHSEIPAPRPGPPTEPAEALRGHR
jgi:phosphatidylglycerophosphate synthase